jgi:hypothetical protein
MRLNRRAGGGDRLSIAERFGVGVQRRDGSQFIPGLDPEVDGFQPFGWLTIQVFDSMGRETFATQTRNLVVNQGKNNLLNVYFADGTQTASTSWFMGLIDSTGFTGIAAGDTASSHAGWSEFTGYSQSNRVAWGQAGPSSGVTTITNASPVTFDITSTATLKGGFIITNNTKGGTTGILWAAALFAAAVPVNNGDQMKCTYNLSC